MRRRDTELSISGFSLVELSIVLVILGLLTGGILAGQSLIRASELRAASTEYQRYATAVNSFRDKYFAVPGDFNNAVKFWGNVAGNATDNYTATCAATASTTITTCNGNGDGNVADGTYEMFRIWQHLANAGLIEGSYTGVQGPNGVYHHVFGTNAPPSKMNNSGWGLSYLGNFGGDAGTYAIFYPNTFWFGITGGGNARPQNPNLKPEEAWNIDTKMDDGKPGTGKIVMRSGYAWGNASACSTSTSFSDFTGEYNLSVSAVSCSFMIKTQ